MEALFIGHAYIDVTFLADALPRATRRSVAHDYAVAFGGNATTAAFCCAKLGVIPDLITTNSNDWLGRMFLDMAAKYGISVHPRKVRRSSLSFIMPKDGKRAIVRAATTTTSIPIPISTSAIAAPCTSTAILPMRRSITPRSSASSAGWSRSTAAACAPTPRSCSILSTSRSSPSGCASRWTMTDAEMLDHLKAKGCNIAGVTQGERGMVWYDETGRIQRMPALVVPRTAVVDTNGAGDIFHGSYMYSYLTRPLSRWEDHFRFASAASTHAIQYLGNEAKLPTRADVEAIETRFQPAAA